MTEQIKPSSGALKAAGIIIRGLFKATTTDVEIAAQIIDRETGVAELLEAAKMAESSLFCLEACNLWTERDHQRLNQLRRAIAKAEAK